MGRLRKHARAPVRPLASLGEFAKVRSSVEDGLTATPAPVGRVAHPWLRPVLAPALTDATDRMLGASVAPRNRGIPTSTRGITGGGAPVIPRPVRVHTRTRPRRIA